MWRTIYREAPLPVKVHKSIKHKQMKKGNKLVEIFRVKNIIMDGLETGRRKTALTERRCENNESSRAC